MKQPGEAPGAGTVVAPFPKDEDAIATLIELASSHASPSVRRSAMFGLARSGGLRATAFFDQVLRRTV